MNFLVFGFLTAAMIVHELGHFIVAKLSGVRVEEFSLFVGPKIFSKKIYGTDFTLRSFPFAAYVRMDQGSFEATALYKRILILLGGVAFNFAAALLIWFVAIYSDTNSFQLALNGSFHHVTSFFESFFSSFNINQVSSPVGLVVEGGDYMAKNSLSIQTEGPKVLGTIAEGKSSKFDYLGYHIFSAINLSLFVTNLLPLSVLDGGQIMFSLLYPIFGRNKGYKTFKLFADRFSIGLLLSLLVYGLGKDLIKIFS
jgi:membrane-associated protease RseP (regulator of RpoE activity)